jgi:hypothetical protein
MFYVCICIWAVLSLLSIILISRVPHAKEAEHMKKLEFLHGDHEEPISVKEAVHSL